MEPTDHDMYRAAIHGAFELFIRNMSRPLFAIAFGALQNGEEAEDVVQDAFVKAWKARWRCAIRRNFRPGSPPSYAIAPRHPDAPPDHSDGRAGSADGDNDVTFKA